MGKQLKQWQILFSWAPKSLHMVTAAIKLKDTCSLEESYDQLGQHIKSRDITLPTKVHLVKAMVFPVVMYECESWTIKKAEQWRMDAFELWCWRRLLRVHQSWIFTGRTDADVETPILGPPDANNWLIGKEPDAGNDWRREEKGMTKDQMVGW